MWSTIRDRSFVVGCLALIAVFVSQGCAQRRGIADDGDGAAGATTDGAGAGGAGSPGSGGTTSSGGSTGSAGNRAGSGGTNAGGANTGGVFAGGRGGTPVGSGGSSPTDASIDAVGDALAPAKLTVSSLNANYDFGKLETGIASAPATFTIMNVGATVTGTLSLTNDKPQEVSATGCTGTLAAGASCTLSVTFKPSAGGARTAALSLGANPGGIVFLSPTAYGVLRLTVTTTGTGTVTSTPTGLTCTGTSCTGLFSPGVVLHARPGTDQRFSGWTGGGCSADVIRDCGVALPGPTTVTATFVPLTANLIFVTKGTFGANLAAPANYDDQCNLAATAAGINDASGKTFVALMSSAASPLTTRLGSARGWVRLDGRPVFDTLSAAFDPGQMFNAVQFDETGTLTSSSFVLSGFNADGSSTPETTCANWTTASMGSGMTVGRTDGGPTSWVTGSGLFVCSFLAKLYCLGKTRTTTLKPIVTAGKRIWVAPGFSPGGGKTPDAVCQASRPSDVTTAVALIATTGRAASMTLSPTVNYVRPDGTLVGTGAQLADGAYDLVQSGVWQYGDGKYVREALPFAWTGSPEPKAVGTAAETCGNWTATTGTASIGDPGEVLSFWSAGTHDCGDASTLIYCVQSQ